MALSEELKERFRALYLAKFGEEIDAAAAEQELKELAELVRLTSPREEQ